MEPFNPAREEEVILSGRSPWQAVVWYCDSQRHTFAAGLEEELLVQIADLLNDRAREYRQEGSAVP